MLSALEEVVASHVDKAEVLLASMQGGESEQVVAVLEHGLALLEKLSVSTPRKARKAIKELSEQVEHVIDGLDEDGAMEQLASCELAELTALAEQLTATSSLDGDAGDSCVPTMKTMLATLTRCRDPVLRASVSSIVFIVGTQLSPASPPKLLATFNCSANAVSSDSSQLASCSIAPSSPRPSMLSLIHI